MSLNPNIKDRRLELRELNIRASQSIETFKPGKSLDTSLKKNSSVIKKLRVIGPDQLSSLIQDISTTSLEKYLNEVVLAVVEGVFKCKKDDEIFAAVEVISLLHRRFVDDFTPHLVLELLSLILDPKTFPEREELTKLAQLKTSTKILTELVICGVLDNDYHNFSVPDLLPSFITRKVDQPILLCLVRLVFSFDKHTILTAFITSYLKKYIQFFTTESKEFMEIFYTEQWQGQVTDFFEAYTKFTHDLTLKTQRSKLSVNDKLNVIANKIGKVVEDLEDQAQVLDKAYQRLLSLCEILNSISSVEMPDFQEMELKSLEKATHSKLSGIIVAKQQEEPDNLSPWDNEQDRNFYCNLPDLTQQQQTPSVLTTENPMGLEVDEFLKALDGGENLKEVDEATAQFWTKGLNNKATLNRLSRHFVHSKESAHSKNHARFLAINKTALPELLEDVLSEIDKRLRSQIHTEAMNLKFLFFFFELIKFKLAPAYVVFHKLRSLILNITKRNNVEILGLFFEHCGKFMLRDPFYKATMEENVQLLREKRQTLAFNFNLRYSIDSILLIAAPQEVKKIVRTEVKMTPEELFLKRMLSSELNMHSIKEVQRLLGFYDFKQLPKCYDILKHAFTHPEEIDYTNVKALALLISSYTEEHDWRLRIYVVDSLIEKIQVGLELNDYRANRSRLAVVSLFSWLSRANVVSLETVVAIMYRILCFGHPQNNPMFGHVAPLDPPDNYFRISLVCQIMSIAPKPVRFVRLAKKYKLFILYFDYYCNLKKSPIPLETNFKIVDMLNRMSPDFKRSSDWKEAAMKLQLAMAENAQSAGKEEVAEEEFEEEELDEGLEVNLDDESDGDQSGDENDEEEEDGESDSLEEEEGEGDDSDSDENSDDSDDDDEDDEEEEVDSEAEEVDLEAKLIEEEERKWQEKIDEEMKRVVKESIEKRKQENVAVKSIPLPGKIQEDEDENNSGSLPTGDGSKMSFRLLARDSLVKPGKKPKVVTKKIEISTETRFVTKLREEESRRKEEADRLKDIILNMNFAL